MLADIDGNITDTYTYDAFGNIISQTGETENNYLYCGEQYDGTTGYYYLRARYMNPQTGTFVTMDTYQGAINDSVSLHKYLYANANPVMNIDPTGNFSVAATQTCAAMAAMLATVGFNVYLQRANELLNASRGEVIGGFTYSLGANVQEMLIYVGGWAYAQMLVDELLSVYSANVFLISSLADQIIKQVKAVSQEVDKDKKYEDTSVYTLMRKEDNEVYYVGISNDPMRRKSEHERKEAKATGKKTSEVDIPMKIVASGLPRELARAYEQVLICTYTKDALKNARYEISKQNYDKYLKEINRVAELLKIDSPDSLMADILDY